MLRGLRAVAIQLGRMKGVPREQDWQVPSVAGIKMEVIKAVLWKALDFLDESGLSALDRRL